MHNEILSPASNTHRGRSALLTGIGYLLRARRTSLALSKRELANRAQISERYLAELEAGNGNCSVPVLERLADALSRPIKSFFDKDESRAPTARPFARRIALVGLRGAGKRLLGKMLANEWDYEFVELDKVTVDLAGCSLKEMHALYGADAYQRYTVRAVERVTHDGVPSIIASPAELVCNQAAYSALRSSCLVIWVRAKPEECLRRVIGKRLPGALANNQAALEDAKDIRVARGQLYATAHLHFDTDRYPLWETFTSLRDTVSNLRVHEIISSPLLA